MFKQKIQILLVLCIALFLASSVSAKTSVIKETPKSQLKSDRQTYSQIVNDNKLRIFGNNVNRTSSIVLPNGKTAVLKWSRQSNGSWVARSITFENGKKVYCSNVSYEAGPCDDAIVANGIALVVCATSPGSLACAVALTNAAWATYKCLQSKDLVQLSETVSINSIRPKNGNISEDTFISLETEYSKNSSQRKVESVY